MPEYLAPGVYVEEVSFRSKSIEGVPTSTTGYAGLTHYGPVQYPNGPTTSEPRLVTSFTDFERVYGGLDALQVPTAADDRLAYTAHAARAFFLNGGAMLYISRVFAPRTVGGNPDYGVASLAIPVAAGATATWRARWPGAYGNVWVNTTTRRTKNVAYVDPNFGVQARGVQEGAVLELIPAGTTPPSDPAPLSQATLVEVDIDPVTGKQRFLRGGATVTPGTTDVLQLVELSVSVNVTPDRTDAYTELATSPAQTRYIGRILGRDDPEDEDAVPWLDWDPSTMANDAAATLMVKLTQTTANTLTGGHDGDLATPDDLNGQDADPDDPMIKATGLSALGEIDDIAIIAMPDAGAYDNDDDAFAAADYVIAQCEQLRYRFGVIDGRQNSSMTHIQNFRGRFDSKYAALYHPWIEILDPTQRPAQGAPPQKILLPPSGFVTGIYARSDIDRGVWKAPANEVVLGLTKFEFNINKARQEVLNPMGINALRFFPDRGYRVWGARTVSSDPEWMYVNVRRLFIFLEHSIDKGTQWAVFEPNGPRLWNNVQRTIEDFLLTLWSSGALIGDKPDQAYFVRCDRTTMTQNDLDNGRMICLIGVAPIKPAEFVIFRIGQWTGDAVTTPTT